MRAESGTCIFLEENRCAVHEPLGGLLKPLACKQFPISLTATPAGGRITTEHKCPCRTLGERPALTVEDALPAVTQRGKLAPVARVGTTVPVTYERSVPFAEYRAEEAALSVAGVSQIDQSSASYSRRTIHLVAVEPSRFTASAAMRALEKVTINARRGRRAIRIVAG